MREKTIYLTGLSLALLVAGCSQQPNERVATRLNHEASTVGDLSFQPLKNKVITSWIDKSWIDKSGTDKQASTMSTLFGNDIAVSYARTNTQHDYPAGSVLYLATWSQQEDPRWFGGNIPAAPKSVEVVTVSTTADHHLLYSYQQYTGSPLKQVAQQQGTTPGDRAAYLLSQRSAVFP
jgi:hypothetical protein